MSLVHNKLITFFLTSITLFSSVALPYTCSKASRSLSLSLHPVKTGTNGRTHPTIAHQQHINRGVRRLAMMTGQPLPTRDELLSNLYTRIMGLPEGIQLLAQSQNSTPSSTPAKGHHSLPVDIEANDVGYFCEMKIGNPPRHFKVLIDSGSSDLWVGGEGCQADQGGGCGAHTFLGTNSSTTLNVTQQGWFLFYGSGDVSGYLVYDDISIAGLSLRGHKFGIAMTESDAFTSDSVPYDGILGLAKSAISQQRTKPLLEALRDAGQITKAIVSYKISRLADQVDGETQGEMTIGGMNPSRYDPNTLVTMKNVNTNGFWEAPMDGMSVNGSDINMTNRTVVMDTGTTLLIVPQADADAIHNAIPGAKMDTESGAYTVPCTTDISIFMKFGGVDFFIDPRDIAWNPVDENDPEGDCFSGIHGGSFGLGPTHWLAGDTVLKNVYFSTNVDRDEISLASLT